MPHRNPFATGRKGYSRARISPRTALPIRKPAARSAGRRSASSARPSSISRSRRMPGSRPRASGGVSSVPSRSTNRLVKLPSVRKPSASVKSHLERARRRARLVVEGAVAGLVAEAEIVVVDRQRRDRHRTGSAGAPGSGRLSIAIAPVRDRSSRSLPAASSRKVAA